MERLGLMPPNTAQQGLLAKSIRDGKIQTKGPLPRNFGANKKHPRISDDFLEVSPHLFRCIWKKILKDRIARAILLCPSLKLKDVASAICEELSSVGPFC